MMQKDYASKKNWNSYIHKKKPLKRTGKKISASPKKQISKQHSGRKKNNLTAVYYGLLFTFLFGFLFFLSISISYASTSSQRTSLDEFNNFNDNGGKDLLEEYLLANDTTPLDSDSLKKLNYKKVKFFKYRIKKNDTLSGIAQKCNIRTDSIVLTNNISRDTSLKAGQVLIIPNQNGRLITIKKNDSIYTIASRYGISWQNIVDVNNLQSSVLKTGGSLFIPGSKMTRYERNNFYHKPEKKRPATPRQNNSRSSSTEFVFSWPVQGKITSYYGMRKDPFNGLMLFHGGIDVKGKTGTPVKGTNSGTVIFTGWNRIYGNVVMIRHSSKYVSVYAHLNSIKVKKGDRIKQGQIIGTLGNTGRSTAPHLHFEIRVDGKRINPLKLLK